MAQDVQSALRNAADVSHGASSSSANGVLARLQQLLPPLHSPKRNATVPIPPKHTETPNNFKQKSKFLKIRIVTWNMHDSLPKGNLGDLLGPVPAHVERKIENDEERFMLPDLSLDDGHPYHLVVVGGQECPTLSGIPMGLAANFKHKEPKNREFDKDRSNNLKGKEKERQSVARAETLLTHLKHEHFHHHHHHHYHRHHHDHNNMQPGDNTTITSGWSAVLEDWFSNGVGSLTGVKPVVTTGPVEGPTPSTSLAGGLPVTEAPPDTCQPSVIGVNWETTDSREIEDHKGGLPTAIPLHKGPYRLLVKDRLMGIYIAVFVHRDIYPLVKGVSTDTVPTGLIGGRLGNKGGVGVSINLDGTRLLFINAHLAAHDGNTALRIANLTKIKAELTVESFLPPNDPRLLKEDPTEKFDYTWILGDLNFRLDITRLHADWLISKKEFNQALAFDQLNKLVKGNDPAFKGFREGKIDFPPTTPAQTADVAKEESSSSSDVDVDESLSSSFSETSLPDTQEKAIRHPTSALLSQIASKTKFVLVSMGRRMKLKKEGYQTQKTIAERSNGAPVSNSIVETQQHSDRVTSFPEGKSPRLTGRNSNCYDSSSKQRVPSWCDRILWRTTVLPESPKLDDTVMRPKRFGRMLRPFRVYTADSYTFERRVQTVRPKPSSRSLLSKPKGRTTSLDLQTGLTTLLEERNVPGQGSIPGPIRSRSVSVDGEYPREELAEQQLVCSISDSVPTPNRPTALEVLSGPPPASTLSNTKRWLSQLWVKETRLRSDSPGLKSSEKLPRRGEFVCLGYHTLDDEQMARLEGEHCL